MPGCRLQCCNIGVASAIRLLAVGDRLKGERLVDLSGQAFCDVDNGAPAASFIAYLDQATFHFRGVKRFARSLLELAPGEKVLDVGCGCGHDVLELQALVGPRGFAAGIDASRTMIDEAQRRTRLAGQTIHLQVGTAYQLDWPEAYFDACYADRVIQHLAEPEPALHEMLRVLSSDGRMVVIDRDWGMVDIDASDNKATDLVLNHAAEAIRNGRIGRELATLLERRGFTQIDSHKKVIDITSLSAVDTLLDLRVVLTHAVNEKRLAKDAALRWLDDLEERDRSGTFHATVTLFVARGKKSRTSNASSSAPLG